MIKSAAYIEFETGFLKEAKAQGLDVDFLKGLIAEAEAIQNDWSAAYDVIEKQSGDKYFRQKLATDLVTIILNKDPNIKIAGEENPWYSNEMIMNIIDKLGGGGQGGAILGTGAGGLLGLLLGLLSGNPMAGLMLGATGGAGLGGLYGAGKFKDWFGEKSPEEAQATNTQPDSTQGVEQPTLDNQVKGVNPESPEEATAREALEQEELTGEAPLTETTGQPNLEGQVGQYNQDLEDLRVQLQGTNTPSSMNNLVVNRNNVPSTVTNGIPKGVQNNQPTLTQKPSPRPVQPTPVKPLNVGQVKPGPMMSTQPPKPTNMANFGSKIASLIAGMAGPQSSLSGPMTQPQTTSTNPLLPNNAPIVSPPAQPIVTPGGSTITAKRQVQQVF